MDLRSIMNSDAAGASNPPAAASASSQQSPVKASNHSEPAYPQQQQHAAPPAYPPGYPGRPPQPPLHPIHTTPDRTSSYGSAQSPYQYNSAPPYDVRSQRGPSPHGPTPYALSRDAYGTPTAYHHPQQQQPPPPSVLASPYTPQSAGIQQSDQQSYFAHQRSQSIQSVSTPYNQYNHSFQPRDSPHSGPSQSVGSQKISPSAHRSLPGTPGGPAPASYARQSPVPGRPPSGHEPQPNPLASPWARQDAYQDQRGTLSPSQTRSRPEIPQVDQTPRHYPAVPQRERSESVSPKTIVPPGQRQGSREARDSTDAPQVNHSEDKRVKEGSTGPIPPPGAGVGAQIPHPSPSPPQVNSSPSQVLPSNRAPEDSSHPIPSKMDTAPAAAIHSSAHPPKRKRMRYDEPPIYAQKSTGTRGRTPAIPNTRPPVPKHLRQSQPGPLLSRKRSTSANAPAVSVPTVSQSPVEETSPANGPPVQHAAEPQQLKSLGPWEPSIAGYIPHEETTKIICDFLFQHVVMRNDVEAAPAGSAAPGQGAIIEVEGKLGHLIDMERGDRLRLPILTESILNKDNPRFRTSFESSMTLGQHRAMNNFLNESVKASMPHSNPSRIPLSYAHKKERDTFYEIPPAELPPVIRQNLNPRHKPRVRVTTDQRTGEILAKIVKCRVADLDIHSPRTCVDWRISVNLEMGYDGDVRHLPVVDGAMGRANDRNKDRMSYRHLAYQIDLTQVAKAEPPTKNDFEHELEIEVSAAEIRRQGHLAMAGDPKNQYEDLIKGFVDNIRLLARAVPP